MTGPPDFDAMYTRDADPWQVAASPYEVRKREILLACLRRPAYRRAWDPGCGTGHLASRLAERADRVLATDASPLAVELTEKTCVGLDNVVIREQRLPEPLPADWAGAPDLVVLSEFFYYLDDRARVASIALIDAVSAPRAELVAVHWRHVPDDAWLGGSGAQQEIVSRLGELGWEHRLHHDDEEFVLDTVLRTGEPA